MQGRNRDAGIQNGCVDTEGGREDGVNWEIGIDRNTVLCIKQIKNENFLCIAKGNLPNALW